MVQRGEKKIKTFNRSHNSHTRTQKEKKKKYDRERTKRKLYLELELQCPMKAHCNSSAKLAGNC